MTDFCCPICKGVLTENATSLRCPSCERSFPILNGIADFFLDEGEATAIDEPNQTWLDPTIVEARDTYYRLCARQLKGMVFCMREIARRTEDGCHLLEVGMGTGHFTRWIAEVATPGTAIYAFDFSWPILKKAQANTLNMPGVVLFRANARAALPFLEASFDIVFLRLAPLGAHGVPNVAAGFRLLKPGGWYFEACWERAQYEETWMDWAIQHGFATCEHHAWQYRRQATEEELKAWQFEQTILAACEGVTIADNFSAKMTIENLLIAQKPFSSVD